MDALLANVIKMSSSSMATHGVVSFSTVIGDDHCTSFTSISHGGNGNKQPQFCLWWMGMYEAEIWGESNGYTLNIR